MNTTSNDKLTKDLFKWHVIYTCPRTEKKVYQRLCEGKIEAYLPLQVQIKQWSNRKKKITVPLFNSYVFVKIDKKDYHTVLNIQGVVKYISFESIAFSIPEKQIDYLKKICKSGFEFEETQFTLNIGSTFIINSGPLEGVEGELIELLNGNRVVLKLFELQKSIFINVPLTNLEIISKARTS